MLKATPNKVEHRTIEKLKAGKKGAKDEFLKLLFSKKS